MAMVMASLGLPLWRCTSPDDTLAPTSSLPCEISSSLFVLGVASFSFLHYGCSGRRHQQWRTSSRMIGGITKFSVGRQSRDGRVSSGGWQSEVDSSEGPRKQQSKIVTGALPTAVTAAVTALAVGGAIFALTRLNKDTIPVLQTKKECEVCGGSGVCPTCNGEGFVNKTLSTEAAAKARARAKDAATRYTAGLAKKWNYCTTCAGQRGCQACEGRGWVQ